MFLMVVNKKNCHVGLLNTIDGHTRHALVARLEYGDVPDRDMINGFPVPVMHHESLPICREARREQQFVYFKPESKE